MIFAHGDERIRTLLYLKGFADSETKLSSQSMLSLLWRLQSLSGKTTRFWKTHFVGRNTPLPLPVMPQDTFGYRFLILGLPSRTLKKSLKFTLI